MDNNITIATTCCSIPVDHSSYLTLSWSDALSSSSNSVIVLHGTFGWIFQILSRALYFSVRIKKFIDCGLSIVEASVPLLSFLP